MTNSKAQNKLNKKTLNVFKKIISEKLSLARENKKHEDYEFHQEENEARRHSALPVRMSYLAKWRITSEQRNQITSKLRESIDLAKSVLDNPSLKLDTRVSAFNSALETLTDSVMSICGLTLYEDGKGQGLDIDALISDIEKNDGITDDGDIICIDLDSEREDRQPLLNEQSLLNEVDVPNEEKSEAGKKLTKELTKLFQKDDKGELRGKNKHAAVMDCVNKAYKPKRKAAK